MARRPSRKRNISHNTYLTPRPESPRVYNRASRRLVVPGTALRRLEAIRLSAQRTLAAAARARVARMAFAAALLAQKGQRNATLVRAQRVSRQLAARAAALSVMRRNAAAVLGKGRALPTAYFQPGSQGFKRMVALYDPAHTPEHRAALEECVKRKLRREVMFAKGVGGSAHVSRERNWKESSNIKC